MKPSQITTLQAATLATLGAGFISVAIFLGGFDPKTGAPDPIVVDDQTIEFTWTDENTKEDLEIWTDKQTYNDGFSGVTVYAALKNNSEVAQDVSLMGYFVNQRRYINGISVLTEVTYPGEDIFETVCQDAKATTTKGAVATPHCEQVLTGKGEDIVKLEWVDLPQKPRTLAEVSKEVTYLSKTEQVKKGTDGYIAEYKSFDFPTKPGQVIYYKLDIKYPANDEGNFYLEAVGSEGGYGHLDPWFDADWTYRVSITVDDTKVPSTQTSFPVYVDLSDLPADFHTNVKTDGCDIRVVEADETTETAFELVTYNSGTDTGELHFMADSLTGSGGGDTTFWIYYGNAAASCYAVTDTYGRNAVWTGYRAVYHYQTLTTDSTGNGYTLTNNGSVGQTTGQLAGQSADFGTTNSSKYLTNASNLGVVYNGPVTVSSWYTIDTLPSSGAYDNWYHLNTSNGSVGVYIRGGYENNAGTRRLRHFVLANVPNVFVDTNINLTTTVWYHGVITWDNTTVRAYQGGSEYGNQAKTGSYSQTANLFELGSGIGSGDWHKGKLDETRVSNTALSANRIATEYNNQSDPGTFYAVGTQETNGGGAARRIINVQ